VPLDDGLKQLLDSARNDLAGHQARMAALRNAATGWQRVRATGVRDAAVEARVAEVVAAIVPAGTAEPNAYDAEGMGPGERRALGELLGAIVQIQGRLPVGERRAVAVHIDSSGIRDRAIEVLPALIQREIEAAGFAIAAQPQQAAMTVRLSNPAARDAGIHASTGQLQRQVTMSGGLQWLYTGKQIDLGVIAGTGAARDPATALDNALAAAARSVAETIRTRLEAR
jgi:hypothetical protein